MNHHPDAAPPEQRTPAARQAAPTREERSSATHDDPRCTVACAAYNENTAAIAGGLLGARDGLPAIPTGRVEVLQFRDEFLTAAHRLAAIAPTGTGSGC